jgi:ferredoxin-NADP reductase
VKRARVIRTERFGADVRWLELVADDPLGFIGGQFVTVDTGRVTAAGKPIRRAYSVLSADSEQRHFELASKRIPDGPVSGYVHELTPDAEVRFTGPWGKFFPAPGATGETLVLATDTGVTAALGLIRGRAFEPLLEATTFVWLRSSPDYFLPEELVRARIPAACGEVRVGSMLPIGNPERVAPVRALVAGLLETSRFAQAFVSGDGAVNYALLADLDAAGVPCTRDQLESFFNMPKKAP